LVVSKTPEIWELWEIDNDTMDTNGTSLKGITTRPITIHQAHEIFGQDKAVYPDEKVACEWTIRFLKDGKIATIYAMNYQLGLKRIPFHIGGHSKNVVWRVNKIIRKWFNDNGIKANNSLL